MKEIEEKIMVNIFKNFIPIEYWDLYDWTTIIKRKKKVKDGVWMFDFHILQLYFDDNMQPVTYGKQKVVGDEVYYDLNEHVGGAGTLTYLGDKCYND